MTTLYSDVDLNSGSVDVTIYEDTDGDGTAENTETVSVPDGSGSTSASNIEGYENHDYWLDVDFSGDPEVYSLSLEIQQTILLSGTTTATSTATGVLDATRLATGSASPVASATGVMAVSRALVGSTTAAASNTAILDVERYLAASASSASTASAVVSRTLTPYALPTWRLHAEGEDYAISVAGIESETPTITPGTEIEVEMLFYDREANPVDYNKEYRRVKNYMDTAGEDLVQYGDSHAGTPWFRERSTANTPVDSYLLGVEPDEGVVDASGWWGLLTDVEDASEPTSPGGMRRVSTSWYILAPFDEYSTHADVRADLG